jgi:hypothetical protein
MAEMRTNMTTPIPPVMVDGVQIMDYSMEPE